MQYSSLKKVSAADAQRAPQVLCPRCPILSSVAIEEALMVSFHDVPLLIIVGCAVVRGIEIVDVELALEEAEVDVEVGVAVAVGRDFDDEVEEEAEIS